MLAQLAVLLLRRSAAERLQDRLPFAGIEGLAPFFHPLETYLDYLGEGDTILWMAPDDAASRTYWGGLKRGPFAGENWTVGPFRTELTTRETEAYLALPGLCILLLFLGLAAFALGLVLLRQGRSAPSAEEPVPRTARQPQDRVATGGHARVGGVVGAHELEAARLDAEPAPVGHGVAGVHREVHEQLLELTGIGLDLRQPAVERAHHLDVLSDEPSQQAIHARD